MDIVNLNFETAWYLLWSIVLSSGHSDYAILGPCFILFWLNNYPFNVVGKPMGHAGPRATPSKSRKTRRITQLQPQ